MVALSPATGRVGRNLPGMSFIPYSGYPVNPSTLRPEAEAWSRHERLSELAPKTRAEGSGCSEGSFPLSGMAGVECCRMGQPSAEGIMWIRGSRW
jgi:hypothetical protein